MRRIASNHHTRQCPRCDRPLKGNAAYASHERACVAAAMAKADRVRDYVKRFDHATVAAMLVALEDAFAARPTKHFVARKVSP